MANYAVTSWTTTGDYDTVAAAIITKINTIDDTKVIRVNKIVAYGNEFIGILVYDS